MERLLCHCLVVSEGEALVAIRAGARTVEEVGLACEAGTGCGSCRAGIAALLQQEAERRTQQRVPDAVLDQLSLFTPRQVQGTGHGTLRSPGGAARARDRKSSRDDG